MSTQMEVCAKYRASYVESPAHLKLGIARNVQDGLLPINGLRLRPEPGTTGWFIWAGEEMSQEPDFFVPLHVSHLDEWCPEAVRFLGLPPGWRFLGGRRVRGRVGRSLLAGRLTEGTTHPPSGPSLLKHATASSRRMVM
jgi:hypothetical protein